MDKVPLTSADYVPLSKDNSVLISNIESYLGEPVCEQTEYQLTVDPYHKCSGGDYPELPDNPSSLEGFIVASDEKFKPILDAGDGDGWKSVFYNGDELPAYKFAMFARQRKVIFIENKDEQMTIYAPLLGSSEFGLKIQWVSESDSTDQVTKVLEEIKGGLI